MGYYRKGYLRLLQKLKIKKKVEDIARICRYDVSSQTNISTGFARGDDQNKPQHSFFMCIENNKHILSLKSKP